MVTDYMPAFVSGSTSTGNHVIVGDFSACKIAMRQGLTVEPVPHAFQQAVAGSGIGFPTAQRGFLAWGRWGADTTTTTAFRLLNQT
jgi:predicted phage gp36 major capsid-like protein